MYIVPRVVSRRPWLVLLLPLLETNSMYLAAGSYLAVALRL